MSHINNYDKNGAQGVFAGFTPTLICSGAISDTKTVTFPTGFSAASEENLAFKVVFVNGHNALNPYDNMTLNGVAVVTNQQGTLAPIPIHEITESGNTVYKVLGANVALDFYYTSDYDGNGTAAYVVVGNPVVLSSSDYTIYADGHYIKRWEDATSNSFTLYCEEIDGVLEFRGTAPVGTATVYYPKTYSSIPVQKGDSVYCYQSGGTFANTVFYGRYYKYREI